MNPRNDIILMDRIEAEAPRGCDAELAQWFDALNRLWHDRKEPVEYDRLPNSTGYWND